jgi:hypothetical protein
MVQEKHGESNEKPASAVLEAFQHAAMSSKRSPASLCSCCSSSLLVFPQGIILLGQVRCTLPKNTRFLNIKAFNPCLGPIEEYLSA